jgi:hypothetical protein
LTAIEESEAECSQTSAGPDVGDRLGDDHVSAAYPQIDFFGIFENGDRPLRTRCGTRNNYVAERPYEGRQKNERPCSVA